MWQYHPIMGKKAQEKFIRRDLRRVRLDMV